MRSLAVAVLLLTLTACTAGSSGAEGVGGNVADGAADLTAAEAVQQTCAEVRAGIDDFNRQDYAGTIDHFEKAKVPAKVYATIEEEPEADALLDAVEYYAALDADQYPEAARSSENFARNKEITLTQCASDEPIDATPGTPV